MHGQSGTEFLVLVGILLAIVVPVFVISSQTSSLSLKAAQVRDAVQSVQEAADRIHNLGGGKTFVFVSIPDGVTNYTISGKEIKLTYRVGDGTSDALRGTLASVMGNMPTEFGRHKVFVERLNNGTILIYSQDSEPPDIVSVSPSGTIPQTTVEIKVITNEDATCRLTVDSTDTVYASMGITMSGSGTIHTHIIDMGGPYPQSLLRYTRCQDTAGNTMLSSAVVSFTVDPSVADTTPPVVVDTRTNVADPKIVVIGSSACVIANATDNIGLDKVWGEVGEADGVITNYTMSANDACNAIDAKPETYSVSVLLGKIGNYTINTSYANDSSGNTGVQLPKPGIVIQVVNVSSGYPSKETCRALYPCIDLSDIGVDYVYHYGYSGASTNDVAYSLMDNITVDELDDDKNTPSQNYIIKRNGDSYDSFVAQINNDTNQFSRIDIYGRVGTVENDPFNLTIYAYKPDKLSLNMSANVSFLVPASVLTQKVKWFQYDITNVTRAMAGMGIVKIRIATDQNLNKKFQFTELHFKVGT